MPFADLDVFMRSLLNGLFNFLEPIFGIDWVAALILAPTMLLISTSIGLHALFGAAAYFKAARLRTRALIAALGTDVDPSSERHAFGKQYDAVSAAMAERGPGAQTLALAWQEFRESIVDETENPIRNTTRPGTFFGRAAPRQAHLLFWSNVMVAIGLLLTFLGLIIALRKASEGIQNSDPVGMQAALVTLLTVAGAKFSTSVAGVGGSIILRAFEYSLHRKAKGLTDQICSLLERGLLYVPAQRLAIEQLAVMREQRDQLLTFNTDFALQLSERMGAQFQQAIVPVTTSLHTLNENIERMGHGLGQGAAQAIHEASGGELRALGQTLATLSDRLDQLSGAVGQSGDDAARQIRAAGDDLSKAAVEIREAFAALASHLDGAGTRLAERTGEVAHAQSEALARVLKQIEEGQLQSTRALSDAVGELHAASGDAARNLQRAVSESLAEGVVASSETYRAAIQESGDGLKSAADNIVRAIANASRQIEVAAAAFAQSGDSASRTSEALADITAQSKEVATSLGDASKGFIAAAAPVVQASRSVGDAALRIQRSIEGREQLEAATLKRIEDLSEGLRRTHAAAESAWRDYQMRFEAVDKALEGAAVKLGETLGDSFDRFKTFARELDKELAAAVGKLSGSISQIEDYAEALDAYTQVSRIRVGGAAE